MTKKYLAVLLTGIMLVSTVVGCKKNDKPGYEENGSTTIEEIKGTSASEETDESITEEVECESTTVDMEQQTSVTENGETSSEDITTEYETETTEPITEPSLEGETETTFVSEYEPETDPFLDKVVETDPSDPYKPIIVETIPQTTPAPGEIVTDYVFIEDKNPNLVEGRYEYIPKNVNDKTIHCFYIKDVQDEWEWDVFGDSYYLKWNDWMYFKFDTKSNSNIVTNTLQNNDEKYEGLVLNDQTYKDINHVIKIKTDYSFRKINDKETNVKATFIKPYFYDKTTQTITIKSKELVPKDIYMKYIVQDINSYSYDQIIKDILIEEAGSFYDFYVFWYNNLKGTEFEVFAQETIGLNGVDKFINLYYHDLSEFYDNKMEAIDRMNNKK